MYSKKQLQETITNRDWIWLAIENNTKSPSVLLHHIEEAVKIYRISLKEKTLFQNI
jgi:hypothetical protein